MFSVSVFFEKLFRNMFEVSSKEDTRLVFSSLNTDQRFFFTPSIYFLILFHHYQGSLD